MYKAITADVERGFQGDAYYLFSEFQKELIYGMLDVITLPDEISREELPQVSAQAAGVDSSPRWISKKKLLIAEGGPRREGRSDAIAALAAFILVHCKSPQPYRMLIVTRSNETKEQMFSLMKRMIFKAGKTFPQAENPALRAYANDDNILVNIKRCTAVAEPEFSWQMYNAVIVDSANFSHYTLPNATANIPFVLTDSSYPYPEKSRLAQLSEETNPDGYTKHRILGQPRTDDVDVEALFGDIKWAGAAAPAPLLDE